MGLNKVELAVLRFACLVNCYKPLEAAAELAKLWHVSLDSVIDQLGLSLSGEDD